MVFNGDNSWDILPRILNVGSTTNITNKYMTIKWWNNIGMVVFNHGVEGGTLFWDKSMNGWDGETMGQTSKMDGSNLSSVPLFCHYIPMKCFVLTRIHIPIYSPTTLILHPWRFSDENRRWLYPILTVKSLISSPICILWKCLAHSDRWFYLIYIPSNPIPASSPTIRSSKFLSQFISQISRISI